LLLIANSSRAAWNLTFQEGDGSAYSATKATTINDISLNFGTATVVTVVTSTNQALIQFPDIIGPNAGQIPPGSTILSATLTMTLNQAPNEIAANDIHESYYSWDEYTITGPIFYAFTAPQYGPIAGTLDRSGPGLPASGDATAIVQHWSDGTPNRGFLLHRVDASTPEEGVYITQYYSDDVANVALRPKLTVEFLIHEVPVEPSTWGKVKALYR
jgi:hypothetical protein